MTEASPPLRFLALVIGGWVCGRAVFLGAEWMAKSDPPSPIVTADSLGSRNAEPGAHRLADAASALDRVSDVSIEPVAKLGAVGKLRPIVTLAADASQSFSSKRPRPPLWTPPLPDRDLRRGPEVSEPAPIAPSPATVMRPPSRFSGSAWLFARRGQARQLAAGGLLGASQVGGRLLYRVNDDPARPLSVSARFYSPLKIARQAEAAIGVEWQPAAKIPLRLLAERRLALGREGRSAFSILAQGGVSDAPLAGAARLDLYGQAGMVGLHSRDLFADGSARVLMPLNSEKSLRIGAGLWGAAQPNAERLDVGPAAAIRIVPHVSVAAEWRFRIAGDARPASGPALTLSTDF